mmetsp:Transcript_18808/g.26664  ORF Transcript_18808/g.26664 Transcript_18808/m.26664 type:complete len:212 (+) Transcript_18808:909-1544(+)
MFLKKTFKSSTRSEPLDQIERAYNNTGCINTRVSIQSTIQLIICCASGSAIKSCLHGIFRKLLSSSIVLDLAKRTFSVPSIGTPPSFSPCATQNGMFKPGILFSRTVSIADSSATAVPNLNGQPLACRPACRTDDEVCISFTSGSLHMRLGSIGFGMKKGIQVGASGFKTRRKRKTTGAGGRSPMMPGAVRQRPRKPFGEFLGSSWNFRPT